jgi:teichuronic acid biosynthesis glycosyltransferase TuaC
MRVLVVTNMYPTAPADHGGVFVKREVDALLRLDAIEDMRVIFVDTLVRASRYLTQRGVVKAALEEYEPDVIHAHYGLTQLVLPKTTAPLVVTFHGSDLAIWWQRLVSRHLARRAAALVVVSPDMAQGVAGLPAPVSVVPCGVDTSLFTPGDRACARATLGLPLRAKLVGFPSSPERGVKDYPLFSEAMALLGGAAEPVLLGGTSPEDMPLWLAAIDVVMYTSKREGSPVLSKEALCCGTRVVAVPSGDLAVQIDGLSGCELVESRKPADLAVAVERVLDQPRPDARIAAERFSVDAEAVAIADLYHKVAS